MAQEPFDPSLYTRAPVLTIASGITLCVTLYHACPKTMPALVKKAAKKVKTVGDVAQAAWADRQRELGVISDDDSRALDQEADAIWGATRMRLQALAMLPPDRVPEALRASILLVTLFGTDGLMFLREAYPVQWSTMDTLLKRIDADGLAKELDDLAGPVFLAQIRHVHPRYSAMVQAMLKRDTSSGQNLLDQVRAMQRAIVEYATKVAATVDEDDPETVDVARDALRAIEQLREMSGRRVAPGNSGGSTTGGTDGGEVLGKTGAGEAGKETGPK